MVKAVKVRLELLGRMYASLEKWNRTLLVKHLWNVASRKESLWVKWINVVKLKTRSVWDVAADKKDSWFWKCLLNLRDWVSKNIRYQIGDGITINVWNDTWNSDLKLSSFISKKEIFYAGFQDTTNLADVIDEYGWKWPNQWVVKYPVLQNLEVPALNTNPDKAIWVDKNGNAKKYATSIVWKDVRDDGNGVNWKNLVWYSHSIPKHAFILWLAVKQKLCTQDKLQKWYPNRQFECSLCKNEMDTHDHLFFKCDYAKMIWEKICKMAEIQDTGNSWEETVNKMSSYNNNRSVWVIIKKICLAATVYFIWHERNGRLFSNVNRSAEALFSIICDEIRAKLVSIKVRINSNVHKAEDVWNIKFDKQS